MLVLDDDRIEREISKVLAENEQGKTGMVGTADGALLRILVELGGAKRVLEIGTGVGLSSLFLCRGLAKTGGGLITIEAEAEKAARARESLSAAGFDSLVEPLQGDALDLIPKLAGPFDLVFSDAAKTNNLHLFDGFMPKLRVGGIIVSHDVLCAENRKMRDYLDMLKAHPALRTVFVGAETVVMAGDPRASAGLAISHKLHRGLDDLGRWAWHGCEVRAIRHEEVAVCPLSFKLRDPYEDDYGCRSAYAQIEPGHDRKDIVDLCAWALDSTGQQSYSLHVYDDARAYESRDDFLYPRDDYFRHLVARAYRHPRLDLDEIYFYPDRLVFRRPRRRPA